MPTPSSMMSVATLLVKGARSMIKKTKVLKLKAKHLQRDSGPGEQGIAAKGAGSNNKGSDGQGAIRAVEECEANTHHNGARGPVNESMQFWTGPKAISSAKEGKQWEFKCKLCTVGLGRVHTIPCMTDSTNYNEEEKHAPLGNLATHLKHKHECEVGHQHKRTHDTGNNSDGEGEMHNAILAKMLEQGCLNPLHSLSQQGFNQYFAAYILESHHPFTTGKIASLCILFEYIKCCFTLPTDTTHLISITMDNASANKVIAEVVCNLLQNCYKIPFHPKNSQICCAAHIINLVVQKILLTLRLVDQDPTAHDYYEEENKHFLLNFDLDTENKDQQATEADNYNNPNPSEQHQMAIRQLTPI
ncbi:hypothetical protein CONPUDRAFT_68854 [Coniophora puteana RWD-64-598 SS2]|uniref:BED-type domain-containing protein n=1 Tax=Coniophora puteana (strain RWD-64-598) TaxID=741705 RepID=A0A5M3N623_CONPW|nr:uncharacterized protein CONPUDRAFT_68854 [Coniophora puteana RWD-64-598 SS2]EIW86305.1 hypothetical protein CONPUDRAFT_68854 [Coniophora puteana RWD-64-598 SS2]